MALTSPRFVHKSRLVRASNGQTIRKDSRGSHVHLIQMALIDLGYPMPRSIGGSRYSPDGVYGNETVEKVRAFQTANNLSPDGEVGKNTMLALDHFCRNYNHKVTLHFRSISLTNVPFNTSLASAEKIYAQYGIRIDFGSGQSLLLSAAEETTFSQVDGQCNWVINTGEMNRLHAMGGPVPATNVLVYYVRRFTSNNLLGCGGHATNRPACTVAANASRWDTAHEVGHVLLTRTFRPVHVESHKRNLMFPTSSSSNRIPVLTAAQLTRIRSSVCCSSA